MTVTVKRAIRGAAFFPLTVSIGRSMVLGYHPSDYTHLSKEATGNKGIATGNKGNRY